MPSPPLYVHFDTWCQLWIKKNAPGRQSRQDALSLLLLDDLAGLVRAAHFANAVRQFQFAALIALNHARDNQLEVRATLVFAGFRCFTKRDCHVPTSLSESKLPVSAFIVESIVTTGRANP